MSSVLPINTQRYESGDYTLEVTAHPSPLSQWSDRPVVRQLRFNLWSNQQHLAAGDQQQLITLSHTIETYVQRHLNHDAWPSTHQLQLLDQTINLSTLQLFHLAEVLNACGQQQITLPAAPAAEPARRRRRWWTGSAVASVIAAVGVTTIYLQYRPEAFNQLETAQAPQATFEEGAADSAGSVSEASPAPETAEAPVATAPATSAPADAAPQINERKAINQPTAQQPLETFDGSLPRSAPPDLREPATAVPTIEEPEKPEEPTPTADLPAAAPAPAIPPAAAPREPAKIAPLPEVTAVEESIAADPAIEDVLEADDAEGFANSPVVEGAEPAAAARIRGPVTGTINATLDAIATQFAPLQPTAVNYPLIYHLQLSSDGTITAIDPVDDDGPEIALPEQPITPAPGRFVRVELIYTGDNRPVVNELIE